MVTIYVLRQQNNKYYIGKTSNPTYRLHDHFSEGGAAWTKKYKPISIHELRPDRPHTDEQIITQEYMQKYGIDNVRGGPWCKISLTAEEKLLITHIIQSNTDTCYKCGKTGHFATKCRSTIKLQDKKSKLIVCTLCGRDSHTVDNCYASTDVNGNSLSEKEDIIWCCSYCNKEFDSKKGASYHENFYCKHKKKLLNNEVIFESDESNNRVIDDENDEEW